MKRLSLQILITLLIVSLLNIPSFAFAATKTGEAEATLLQEGNYDVEPPLRATGQTAAHTAIYNGLFQVNSEIDLASYSISVNDFDNLVSDVINDHPDLFYVSSSIRFSYSTSTNTIGTYFPEYVISGQELENARNVLNSGVQKALDQAAGCVNDLQKAVVIHDYICSLACYPSIFDDNGNYVASLDLPIFHSAYGFFLNHTVVCAGYTLTYSYLMKLLGVECEYVGSDAMSHAWNKIKIDGEWYNADLTFDDMDEKNAETTYGTVRHSYFLKSDSYFESSPSIAWHYGGSTYEGCAATSTAYDTAFWDDVTSCIYCVDGYYYYLDPPNSANVYIYLKKRAQNGTESNLCSGFRTISLTYSTGFFDASGNQHVISFKDYLARLAYLDGRFYVFYSNVIDAVLLNGTKKNVCSTNTYPSGLGVNERSNLIYHLYNSNNRLYELDKMEYFSSHITAVKGVNYNVYPDINLDGVINGKDYAKIYKAQNS